MKSIIFNPSSLNFGNVEVYKTKILTTNIENTGTERVLVISGTSDKSQYSMEYVNTLTQPEFLANSEIFMDAAGSLQDSNGEYYTTPLERRAGSVDGSGVLTVDIAVILADSTGEVITFEDDDYIEV